MSRIAPSLLSADFSNLSSALRELEKGNADYVHIDIMDGHFVPNITFGPDQLTDLKKVTYLPFDVHLMISDPDRFIDRFAPSAEILTVHYESTPHVQRTLARIRDLGCKPGISINPSTPVSNLEFLIDDVDYILIMSVNPGFGGQYFIPASLEKIRQARQLAAGRNIILAVDGGINEKTAQFAVRAGADLLIAGSYVFHANKGDVAKNIAILRSLA